MAMVAMDVKAACDDGLALQDMNMKLLFQEKGKADQMQALSTLFSQHVHDDAYYPCTQTPLLSLIYNAHCLDLES